MIRAVFFDFYGTLANWAPSAEGIQQAAAVVDGIALDQPAITLAYITANSYFDTENALQPIRQRSKEEVAAFFAEYERRLLTAAGAVDVSLDSSGSHLAARERHAEDDGALPGRKGRARRTER